MSSFGPLRFSTAMFPFDKSMSICLGTFPESALREGRDSVEEVVKMYAARGFPARRHFEEPA